MSSSPVLQFRIDLPFAAAEEAVRAALAVEGFGILTEVNVAAVFKSRLGLDTPPQKLLGACNPDLAHASLEAEPSVGAFLPCGVALREGEAPGQTLVALQNPVLLAGMFSTPGLETPSLDATTRLTRALSSIGSPV